MLLKARSESNELMGMRNLNVRMELSESDKYYLSILESGFEGEVVFDKLAANLKEERYILNDVFLEANNSHTQIDSIIISEGVIYQLDIKNYKGEYYWEDGKLYSKATGMICKNPVEQLNRSSVLFNQFLRKHKLVHLVEPYVIFINPDFTLYQAPMDLPIILPTKLDQFIERLNNTPSRLDNRHKELAQILLTSDQERSRFTKLPEHHYEQMKKGVFCKKCGEILTERKNHHFICRSCDHQEKVESAILRSAEEYKLLFPERKMTNQNIREWCQTDLNRRTISRILMKKFRVIGSKKYTYYE
ncbi:NERD domain-containing protein [Neobacillus notoginsengisoli]|uniref:NERD domain-containing protein n=1 Tax=Neobacillus notoginsengisoli TaxID=1578198 RepID=A0A417YRV1_9BACI|nr:nuclease-related domain-containing protein [Neobacillus notoginsengisoli]RHW38024.1 NERD domain-containing protein [Neobacillus notoginsengisoli]